MATTTVHIPDELLRRIDRAAQSLGVSRNRFVLAACSDALDRQAGEWPEGFFDPPGAEEQRLLEEATKALEQDVLASRRSRGAPAL